MGSSREESGGNVPLINFVSWVPPFIHLLIQPWVLPASYMPGPGLRVW